MSGSELLPGGAAAVKVAKERTQEVVEVAEESGMEQKLLFAFDFNAKHVDENGEPVRPVDLARQLLKSRSRVLKKILENKQKYHIGRHDREALKAIGDEMKIISKWWQDDVDSGNPKQTKDERVARTEAFAAKNLSKLKEIFAHAEKAKQEASETEFGPAASEVQFADSPPPEAQQPKLFIKLPPKLAPPPPLPPRVKAAPDADIEALKDKLDQLTEKKADTEKKYRVGRDNDRSWREPRRPTQSERRKVGPGARADDADLLAEAKAKWDPLRKEIFLLDNEIKRKELKVKKRPKRAVSVPQTVLEEDETEEDDTEEGDYAPRFPKRRSETQWQRLGREHVTGGDVGEGMLLERATVDAILASLHLRGVLTEREIARYKRDPAEALMGTGGTSKLGFGPLASKYIKEYDKKKGDLQQLKDLYIYARPLEGDYSPFTERGAFPPFLKMMDRGKLEMMMHMFDDKTGFGNEANYRKKTTNDRGWISKTNVKNYINAFGLRADGVPEHTKEEVKLEKNPVTLMNWLRPHMQYFYKLLSPAARESKVKGVGYIIRKFLKGDRTTNVQGTPPPQEKEATPPSLERVLSREPEDAPHGDRITQAGVRLVNRTREPASGPFVPETAWRLGKRIVDGWHKATKPLQVAAIKKKLREIEQNYFAGVLGGASTRDVVQRALAWATSAKDRLQKRGAQWVELWAYLNKLTGLESNPLKYIAGTGESDEKSEELEPGLVNPAKAVGLGGRAPRAPRRRVRRGRRTVVDLTGEEVYAERAHAASARFGHYTIHNDLRVENAPVAPEIETSYNHMIQGELAPIGRVHLVSMGPLVGSEESRHFLAEMDADSNMGATAMAVGSRRGPFKHSTGSSRIMDRSAHITYRRRGHNLEITVLRGVSSYEMDTLIGKLGAHRVSTVSTHVFIIDGKRKKLGNIDRVDLEKLRTMIHKVLETRRKVGILLTDTKEHGILHDKTGHERSMKAHMRAHPNGLE